MAKKRRHHKATARSSGIMSMIGKLVAPAAFTDAFVGQLTAKDISNYPSFDTLPNMEKGKFILNTITGRMASFNPFPQYGTPKFTINPAGAFNKYTGTGIGLMVLGSVLPKGVGGKSLAMKAGKGFMWGGIIGGIFDAPGAARTGTTSLGTGGAHAIGNGAAPGGTSSRVQGFGGTYTG